MAIEPAGEENMQILMGTVQTGAEVVQRFRLAQVRGRNDFQKAMLIWLAVKRVQGRAPKVTINQQSSFSMLGKDCGEVVGNDTLSFFGEGTRNKEAPGILLMAINLHIRVNAEKALAGSLLLAI